MLSGSPGSPGFGPAYVAVLVIGCALFAASVLSSSLSCNPNRDHIDDQVAPPQQADMRTPPACTSSSTRCTPDKGAIETCDGKSWHVQQTCNLDQGELCDAGRCLSACEQVTQGNVGCSFFPANLWSTSEDGEFGVVASNTSDKLSAEVVLEDGKGQVDKQTALPGGLVIFRLPHGRNKLNQTEQSQKSFHLQSTAPVAVYQFHPIDASRVFSGSATLLLPEHVMGKNYFVMSYTYNAALSTTPPQGQGFVAVTALEDNTDVEITTPVATAPGPGVPGLKAGETLKRTLKRLEVLEVMQSNSLEDISGAIVKATAKVVVFGGAGGVTIPRSADGGDHLGVQMFPLSTWGKHYVGTQLKQRNETDTNFYRIVASVDNTNVTLSNGMNLPKVPLLKRQAFYEFSTNQDFEITSDQPVLAFQYVPAWGYLSGHPFPDFADKIPNSCPFRGGPDDVKCLGDANVTPLVPVEQYRNDYIFYVPDTYPYDFITVTAPLGTTLTLDKQQVMDPLRPIGNGMIGRVIIRLLTGNHRITGTNPFGLIGYGYSYATSYSYVGGLNLEKINPVE